MSSAAAQIFGAVGSGRARAAAASRRAATYGSRASRPGRSARGGLVAYLAPAGHHRVLAAAAVVGIAAALGGAWVVLRVPWLLALATLACVPARIPVHVGSTQANLLLPLYGVVAVAAIALAWELAGEEPARPELGPLAWPLGSFIGWEGLSFLWTKDVRQGAIELLFFVLPVRPARDRAGPAAVVARLGARALRPVRR